jgi:hypothetical protein
MLFLPVEFVQEHPEVMQCVLFRHVVAERPLTYGDGVEGANVLCLTLAPDVNVYFWVRCFLALAVQTTGLSCLSVVTVVIALVLIAVGWHISQILPYALV